MRRYFLELAYRGTQFLGFQKQAQGRTVQQTIEEALSTLLRTPTEIVGCGRTDTGVHAEQYFAHFDTEQAPEDPADFVRRLNALVPDDIAFKRLLPVQPQAHARFHALSRSYRYYIQPVKDPFSVQTAYYCPFWHRVDTDLLQAAAALLLEYEDFAPFCKTHTDAKTRRCRLSRSEWSINAQGQWVYTVVADRFLRGMVRLVVGMCLQTARGLMRLDEVRTALERQTPLHRALSVPPQGLFLTDIVYDAGCFEAVS